MFGHAVIVISPASCAFLAPIETARPLRHDAFEVELARLGEHDLALART
jgi:hypothetical protein